jgi:hypothetical protein
MRLRRTLPLWIIPGLIVIFLPGCRHQPVTASPAVTAQPPGNTKTFTSKKSNTTYTYVVIPHNEEQFERFEVRTARLGAPSPDDFQGTDRKAAKTSLASGSPEAFRDVAALLHSSLFVADSKMLKHKPPISRDETSDRVAEERHNVVITGFLYASTKESDNDFHCIIGMAPQQSRQFLNVEVSGLPVSGPFRAPLKTVRDAFQSFFGDNLPTAGGYSEFNPPIKVRVAGSIFFDIDHKAGVIGPVGFRPKTAWEIHPVSEIVFEP